MLTMTARGAELVDALRDDLECPGCGYSLRGLHGDDLTCPECGTRINLPRLVAQRWTRPWWEAPLYNTLALPLACALLMGLLTLFLLGVMAVNDQNAAAAAFGLLGLSLAVWLGSFAYVGRRFGSSEGIWLALVVHLILPTYLGGIGFAVSGLLGAIASLQASPWSLAHCAFLFAVGVALIFGGRMTERFIARRCIKRHLRISAATMPA
jgi:hypothetical protein